MRRARGLLRTLAAHLPVRSRWAQARRLVARANAERDARRWQAASALYEEALRLVPDAPRFHIQCGHMHKEAGDLPAAERHYLAASAMLPDDPDVAIQLGHFYKRADRPDDAEIAYAHALHVRPGWREAADELARVGSIRETRSEQFDPDALAAELLPSAAADAPATMREGFHLLRLGANRARVRGAYRRVLRGVEAIRGFVVTPADGPGEVALLLDGVEIARHPLGTHPLGGGQVKRVFNIWHDFSGVTPGSHVVELRTGDRSHSAAIDIAAPLREADHPESDAIVDTVGPDLAAAIAARPSVVRAGRRRLLPPPRAILVQRIDQLGDLVCSVPAIRRLRAFWPEARLVGLVSPANADLARTLGLFDDIELVVLAQEGIDGRKVMPLAEQEALRRRLLPYAFDLAIDLGETAASRPLLLLSGATFLFGFKGAEFPWLTAGLDLATHDAGNHQEAAAHSRKLAALVDALAAIAVEEEDRPLRRSDLSPALLAPLGIGLGERYALLHAGARLAYTRWPGHGELARLLLERTDLRVVILSEEPVAGLPRDRRIGVVDGRLAWDEFDALVSHAALFVGNDSGPKHLASLRGVPVVSLHMARLNWSEWGQSFGGAIVSRRIPCAGCGIGRDPEDCGRDFACLRGIRAEEVLAAGLALLGGEPPEGRPAVSLLQ